MCRLPAIVLLLSVALGGSLPSVAQAQEPKAAEQTPADEPASRPRPAPQTRGEALAAGLQRQLETALPKAAVAGRGGEAVVLGGTVTGELSGREVASRERCQASGPRELR